MAAKFPVVLIVGQAGSGKDTVGRLLAEQHGGCKIALADPIKDVARTVFGFTDAQLWGPSEARSEEIPNRTAIGDFDRFLSDKPSWHKDYIQWLRQLPGTQAENIARFRAWYYDHIWGRKVLTARHVLQTLGTEFGRSIDPDIWVNIALKRSEDILRDTLNKQNLVVISDGRFRNEALAVKRLGGTVIRLLNPAKTGSDPHPSEAEQESLPDFWFDKVYVNHKTGLDNLTNDVRYWAL